MAFEPALLCTIHSLTEPTKSCSASSISFASDDGCCVILPQHEPIFVTLVSQTIMVVPISNIASAPPSHVPEMQVQVKNAGVLCVEADQCHIWVW
jgi:hypothetical protein